MQSSIDWKWLKPQPPAQVAELLPAEPSTFIRLPDLPAPSNYNYDGYRRQKEVKRGCVDGCFSDLGCQNNSEDEAPHGHNQQGAKETGVT
jgi:hypothetical protein